MAQLRERVQAIVKSDVKPVERAEDYQQHVVAISTALEQFQTNNLNEARIHFGKVSAALIAVIAEFPPPLESAVHIMNCPMWDKSPANWIQTAEELENPFMGMKMAHCGDMLKTLEAAK